MIGKRSKQQYADRAQQVVLACATFDQEGKLMVTPGGLLPCRKITNSYIERVCTPKNIYVNILLIQPSLLMRSSM